MSCEGYRDKLIAALASGDSSLAGDVAVHLGMCAECKKFYEAQVHLFGAIDSGVRAMVNEAVPASLLPRVRAQIAEADMPRRMWGVSRSFAAVAVAAVLVISVTVVKRSRDNTNKVADRSPAGGQRASGATGVRAVLPPVAAVGPKRRSTEVKTARAPREAVKTPEVIVLAEERAAFARFVTDLPEQREVAVAFTRPATDAKDEAVEIALLQIDELDVKPLESSNQ
jgi:hypothetical protein